MRKYGSHLLMPNMNTSVYKLMSFSVNTRSFCLAKEGGNILHIWGFFQLNFLLFSIFSPVSEICN